VSLGLIDDITAVGRGAGLDAVGVTTAAPFDEARVRIEERKAAGLHGGMAFTYGRPGRSADPARHLEGARALVVGARRYHRQQVGPSPGAAPQPAAAASGAGTPAPGPPGAPAPAAVYARVARYAWHDHYAELRVGLQAIADRLAQDGWSALVLADDNRLIDRAAAHRAGLGWFGKNTNLLLPGRGSWFVLGAVLTDAPLPATDEPVPDGCGACNACQPACPTGALDEPGVLDARRCLAWLVEAPGAFPDEFRVALGDRLYGCDDCQEACPPNRLEIRRRPSAPAEADDEAWVDVLALLEADDDTLVTRYRRWYVPRRRPEYLRRNALVVLGNIGRGDDSRTESALRAALTHEAAVVRAHAVWAARRLGRDDLLVLVAGDGDPEVEVELTRAVVPVARGGA
jgi:epoxyqueuosine reductase